MEELDLRGENIKTNQHQPNKCHWSFCSIMNINCRNHIKIGQCKTHYKTHDCSLWETCPFISQIEISSISNLQKNKENIKIWKDKHGTIIKPGDKLYHIYNMSPSTPSGMNSDRREFSIVLSHVSNGYFLGNYTTPFTDKYQFDIYWEIL